jgi:hypothetical protein
MYRRPRPSPLLLLVVLAQPSLLTVACGPVTGDMPGPPPQSSSSSSSGSGSSGSGFTGDGGGLTSKSWDANACAPGDVQTFVPGSYVHANQPKPDACQGDSVALLYNACFGVNATVTSCAAFQTLNAACYACAVTPSTASSYGPIIDYSSFVETNLAGCAEVVEAGATTCAGPVQALAECQLAACETNCPVTDTATLNTFSACTDAADRGGCQAYNEAASCFAVDAGALAICDSSDFRTFFLSVVPLFCASSSEEGGAAPSSRDASTD